MYYSVRDVPLPKDGRITDIAGYRLERSARLADAIADFEDRIGAPVYVVTLPSIGAPKSGVKPYATRLFNEWGIGFDGSQRGVLVLIVKDVRRIEIEVGTRLNSVVSHAWTPRMIERDVTPELKEGNYARGVEKAVRRLAARIENGGRNGLPEDWWRSPGFWMSTGKTGEAEDALVALAVGMGVSAFGVVSGGTSILESRRDRTCNSCGGVVTQGAMGCASNVLHPPNLKGQPAHVQEARMHDMPEAIRRVGRWRITKQPTYFSAGRRERTLHCHKCGAISTKAKSIPRLVETSSDTDGGGYSDGGGGGGGDF